MHADGGGRRPAASRPLTGREEVLAFHARLARLFAKNAWQLVGYGFINDLPGFVTREPDGELKTTALALDEGRVTAIYVMRNPDKLRHLGAVH